MAVDVIMPQMGESIFEGTITKWLKKPGDRIERDEPLLEISTDKVDAEIPSPAAGVLREIKVKEGETVPVQTVVGVIDAESAGAGPGARAASTAQKEPGAKPKESPTAPLQKSAAPAPQKSPPAASEEGLRAPQPAAPEGGAQGEREQAHGTRAEGDRRVRSSPLARKLARENNLDVAQIHGTGSGGRVSKQDVLAASAQQKGGQGNAPGAASTAPAVGGAGPAATGAAPTAAERAIPRERIYFGDYQVQPLSIMRQRIAEHMTLSKHIAPHVYSIEEADLTHIGQLREAAKEEFERRHRTKLTFMPFFVQACVDALRDFPVLNSSLDGSNLVLHNEINIGIAVALEEGLIVPVILHADQKNFLGLQVAINDLAERARTKKLAPQEVQNSTFTITNPGIFGGLMGLGVINQPNAAILAIGAIQKRPVVVDDAIAIRSMVYLTMSYDHRIVDGALAHKFLADAKKRLEGWSDEIL